MAALDQARTSAPIILIPGPSVKSGAWGHCTLDFVPIILGLIDLDPREWPVRAKY
jgi:hypothetical protein